MNSINLLDTSAMFWVAAGYAVLLPALAGSSRVSPGRSVATGVLFGLGVLTKDMVAALTVFPLIICLVMKWSMPRRTAMLVAAVSMAMYAPYPIIVALMGQWHQFSQQKFQGLYRFLGILQMTGFHKKGGPSLVQSVLSNLDQYATTYTWIALGVPAIAFLFFRGTGTQRLVSVWAACAYALLGYGMAHGTLEEQFFYFLVVPVFVATTSAVILIAHGDVLRGLVGRLIQAGRLVLALAFLGWSAYVWTWVHFHPDNAWEHMYAYVHQNLPRGVSIGVTAWTGVPLLIDYANIDNVTSIEPLRRHQVTYLEINTHQIEGHFGGVTVGQYDWLRHHAVRVFAFNARSSGTIALYTLPK